MNGMLAVISAALVGLGILSPPLFQAAQAGDRAPDWFYPEWLAKAPYAPVFKVRDTENKYGRYADQTKTITLKDLIKFHGHFCGGLAEGATALRVAFDHLFPDGAIDRTDLRIASKVSACGGDVGAYLTGARTRYASYLLDKKLGASEYVVQQVSTGHTVRVSINTATYPSEVRKQMRKIQSGDFTPADIDLFQKLQWDYAKRLVNRPGTESVDIADEATMSGRRHPAGISANARTTTTRMCRRLRVRHCVDAPWTCTESTKPRTCAKKELS